MGLLSFLKRCFGDEYKQKEFRRSGERWAPEPWPPAPPPRALRTVVEVAELERLRRIEEKARTAVVCHMGHGETEAIKDLARALDVRVIDDPGVEA